MMDYLVIIERGSTGFGAYVPDLPGCVAAGGTAGEVRDLIADAVRLHLTDLRERGLPVPAPTSMSETVRVA